MKLKRIIAIFMMVGCAAFLLSSCGKTACKPVSIEKDFKCHADITQGNATYSAELERGGNGSWKAVFSKPETINGMEVTLAKESVTIEFNGLSYSAPKEEMPEFSVAELVTSAIEQCIEGKVKCYKSGNVTTQEGEIKGIDFKAEVKDNKLTSLKIGKDTTVKIK